MLLGFFVKKSLPLFHDHHQERSKEDLKPLATKQELKGLVTKQQSKAQPLELKAYTDRQVGNLEAMVKRAFLELKSASIQSLINSTAANGLTNTSASSPRWARQSEANSGVSEETPTKMVARWACRS